MFFGVIGFAVLFAAAYLGVRALRGNDPRIVLDTPRGQRGRIAVRDLIDQIPPNVRRELVTIGQPVWWVARGAIGGGGFFALFGAGAVAVVGAIAGAAVSIWIGRTDPAGSDAGSGTSYRSTSSRESPCRPSSPRRTWAASFGFLNDYDDYSRTPTSYNQDGLVLNGTPVSNIYPFDAQGKQVSVRLYDQEGTPIALEREDCATNYGQVDRSTTSNIFPHKTVTQDGSGGEQDCKDSDKAPFVPPPAPATATPTSSPTTSAKTPGVTMTVQPTR